MNVATVSLSPTCHQSRTQINSVRDLPKSPSWPCYINCHRVAIQKLSQVRARADRLACVRSIPANLPINTWPRAAVTFLSAQYVWLLWNAPAHQWFAEPFDDPRLALDSRLLFRALVDPAERARGDLELPMCVREPLERKRSVAK